MALSQSARTFGALFLMCAAVILAVRFPQFIDPFLRHDDYPTLLGDPFAAYQKTLHEGRWTNYWWTIRPFLWPSPVNYIVYMAAWGTIAACVPVVVLKPAVGWWYRAALALIILLAPPALFISGWFTTLILGIWIVALHALVVSFASPRASLISLLVLTPLAFMAYPTYPFFMLALSLLSHRSPKSVFHAALTLGFFVISVVAAMLFVNGMNYLEHGYFGVRIADWRAPNPASTLTEFLQNLVAVRHFYLNSIETLGGGSLEVGLAYIGTFVAALIVLFFREPWIAFLILVAAGIGIAAVVLQVGQNGVPVPMRAFDWIWMLYAVTLVYLAANLTEHGIVYASRLRVIIMVVILATAYRDIYIHYKTNIAWQNTTHSLAEAIPRPVEQIYVYGSYLGLKGGFEKGIQQPRGLRLRLAYLTGATVVLCQETASKCADVQPPFAQRTWSLNPYVEHVGTTVFVLLPEPDIGP